MLNAVRQIALYESTTLIFTAVEILDVSTDATLTTLRIKTDISCCCRSFVRAHCRHAYWIE